MALLEVERNKNCLLYQSQTYEVYHIQDKDYNCDLHILASTKDEREQVLIPVDKNILIKNVPYFDRMFRDDANWIEGHPNVAINGQELESPDVQVFKMYMPKPKVLAEYLKSIYTGTLPIKEDNCADYHHVADFLEDLRLLDKIEEFVKKNINFGNVFQLIYETGGRFDDDINKFFIENGLKDDNFIQLGLDICKMDVGKFKEVMGCISRMVSWAWLVKA